MGLKEVKEEILNSAKKESDKILEKARKEAQEIVSKAKAIITEKKKVKNEEKRKKIDSLEKMKIAQAKSEAKKIVLTKKKKSY